jgi:hypothetical protein
MCVTIHAPDWILIVFDVICYLLWLTANCVGAIIFASFVVFKSVLLHACRHILSSLHWKFALDHSHGMRLRLPALGFLFRALLAFLLCY